MGGTAKRGTYLLPLGTYYGGLELSLDVSFILAFSLQLLIYLPTFCLTNVGLTVCKNAYDENQI